MIKYLDKLVIEIQIGSTSLKTATRDIGIIAFIEARKVGVREEAGIECPIINYVSGKH